MPEARLRVIDGEAGRQMGDYFTIGREELQGLLSDQRLEPSHRLVYLALLSHRNDHEGLAYPGLTALCDLTGYASRTVKQARKELRRTGWIKPAGRKGQVVVYRFPRYRETSAEEDTGAATLTGAEDCTGEEASTPDRCTPLHPRGERTCTPGVSVRAPRTTEGTTEGTTECVEEPTQHDLTMHALRMIGFETPTIDHIHLVERGIERMPEEARTLDTVTWETEKHIAHCKAQPNTRMDSMTLGRWLAQTTEGRASPTATASRIEELKRELKITPPGPEHSLLLSELNHLERGV